MQIVFAGKAHPKDQPGRSLIRDVVQLSRDPELWRRVVFLEDYDMKVAREMVQGVDLWLNTPKRGEEACLGLLKEGDSTCPKSLEFEG